MDTTDLIANAIEGQWGERCHDFSEGCPCCEAWKQYDDLKAAALPSPAGAQAVPVAWVRPDFIEARERTAVLMVNWKQHDTDVPLYAGAQAVPGDVKPPFEFDRYVNGTLMAEGVTIELQSDLSGAMRAAARIASRGPNGEVPVLVLRAAPPAVPVAGKPLDFFTSNVDRWGAAEWFDRLAKAIREQDKAVVAGDELSVETYRNITASSAMRLVREFEAQVRSALIAPAVPSGWVAVPREPTEAMLDTYWVQSGESEAMRSRVHSRAARYYRAMLEAAPAAPVGGE